MRTNCRSDDIKGVFRMAAPVAYSFVGSIFKSHVAACNRTYGSAKHLHTFNVGVLAFNISLAHIDYTLHIHQSAHCGSSYTMLTGTSLSYDTRLAHLACKQYLTDGVVYFMGTCMVKVLALKV